MSKMWAKLEHRIEVARYAFKASEVVFKYTSWLLTLGAVKLAAELTHSRVLWLMASLLGCYIWVPIGYFIVGPNFDIPISGKRIAIMSFELLLVILIGLAVNMRLNIIVDAIVATHIGK